MAAGLPRLKAKHARAAALPAGSDRPECISVFLLCAKASRIEGNPDISWIEDNAMMDYVPHGSASRHFYSFVDTDGNMCLLEMHYDEPGGSLSRILPLLQNPPHAVEDYDTKLGSHLDLGPFVVECKSRATIARVRIPRGYPNKMRRLIEEEALQRDKVAADILTDYCEWRSLNDQVSRILRGGNGHVRWFVEHTLPALERAGLKVSKKLAQRIDAEVKRR
jgi:hypothetical protein